MIPVAPSFPRLIFKCKQKYLQTSPSFVISPFSSSFLFHIILLSFSKYDDTFYECTIVFLLVATAVEYMAYFSGNIVCIKIPRIVYQRVQLSNLGNGVAGLFANAIMIAQYKTRLVN